MATMTVIVREKCSIREREREKCHVAVLHAVVDGETDISAYSVMDVPVRVTIHCSII